MRDDDAITRTLEAAIMTLLLLSLAMAMVMAEAIAIAIAMVCRYSPLFALFLPFFLLLFIQKF